MEYYSHPISPSARPLLENHLKKVADYSRRLAGFVKGADAETAYYAGLLHDVGKLNPYYQDAFSRGVGPDKKGNAHTPSHAVFSAMAVESLLNSSKNKGTILSCVHGHHSSLKKVSQLYAFTAEGTERKKAEADMLAINKALPELLSKLGCGKLRYNPIEIIEFGGNIEKLGIGNAYEEYLEQAGIYSALLLADRGSLTEWTNAVRFPSFDIDFKTAALVRHDGTKLSSIRSGFQKYLLDNNNFQDNLFILEAPTGIGKTRLFLEIIKRVAKQGNFEKAIYFSPLLALSEDFESKIKSTIEREYDERVLSYNHLFKGTLDKKTIEQEDEKHWSFNEEAFNYEMVITTTQRLLMTLFSNKAGDAMKLLPLKKSIMVVDEVQTIPRWLLPSTIGLLRAVAEKMDSAVILVSATIPDEFKGIPRCAYDSVLTTEYLRTTKKEVEYAAEYPKFERSGCTLTMFNTRREAVSFADNADIYISSGVSKTERRARIKKIKDAKEAREDLHVVSTQCLEAGVDISFDVMRRQLAPLDNVIQAMGRLNRHGENPSAKIIVFDKSNNGLADFMPYGQLEFEMTRKFFRETPVTDSISIYLNLPKYYEELRTRHKRNEKRASKIDEYIGDLDFGAVWEEAKAAFPEEEGTVYLPPSGQIEAIREKIKSNGRAPNKLREFSATAPRLTGANRAAFYSLLDGELSEMGVLFPARGKLHEIYDEKVGLDKWLI